MAGFQEDMEFTHKFTLDCPKPVYFDKKNTSIGTISTLALPIGMWNAEGISTESGDFLLSPESHVEFLATPKKKRAENAHQIVGTVSRFSHCKGRGEQIVNIHGVGPTGWSLRKAQSGAVHALLSHWSMSNDVATVVLPTGTGKTETMLVATLVDKAERTLVVVPTRELKDQISDKFSAWGMLRKLGVITGSTPNPKVLKLTKTITEMEHIGFLEQARVVVATPGLLARAPSKLKPLLSDVFSHVYFDEAHHMGASEWLELRDMFCGAKIVQFTATPYRRDRKPIEGKVVYNYPLSQAVADGCFSPISLITVEERHPLKKDEAIARAAMDRLKSDRESGFKKHRMMVRAVDAAAAAKLYESYTSWFPDERIVLIHSKTKGQKAIVENIRADKYDIVICVDMLKEGFDYPNFKVAAVHGIHRSLSVLLQFIGRFTRPEEGLGPASFVVNFADDKLSCELENLLQEGSGWEQVISEVADQKKQEAQSLLAFLQGCKPYSGFDSPDISLNPKLVSPALSYVCFRCESVDWKNFADAFDLNKYALSQPYFNEAESVFYFTTQKREKVKWARNTENLRDQTWDLIALHFDKDAQLLYIGYSEKRLDLEALVAAISGREPKIISGDAVFRVFHSIKRLCIVHAGIFKPSNHLHRYSRLSGADVSAELSRWRQGIRCKKSDFVGVGFRNGFPVSVGASVKGKIWSPARSGNVLEWKTWCREMGALIQNEDINSNELLEDSAQKNELSEYPVDMKVLAADWAENLYDRIHKITITLPNQKSYLLSEATLKFTGSIKNIASFSLGIIDAALEFSIQLGGENGHIVTGLDDSEVLVEGLKKSGMSLKRFFEENPPTMFLLNGCTIAGCIHTDYGDGASVQLPQEQIASLTWEGVDRKKESMFKGRQKRTNSIQEYMMNLLVGRGASVVFNDDNSGESADIVAIFCDEDVVRFEMVHCKYSKDKSGARLSDLYEVCGQAIVSLRYKWKPEELVRHMERRNSTGILRGLRFFHGDQDVLQGIKKAMKYSDVTFEFAVAQPGVKVSAISEDMKYVLGSVYSTIVEMTETKLRCYFDGG